MRKTKSKYSWMRAKSDGREQLVEGQGLWGEEDAGRRRQRELAGETRRRLRAEAKGHCSSHRELLAVKSGG